MIKAARANAYKLFQVDFERLDKALWGYANYDSGSALNGHAWYHADGSKFTYDGGAQRSNGIYAFGAGFDYVDTPLNASAHAFDNGFNGEARYDVPNKPLIAYGNVNSNYHYYSGLAGVEYDDSQNGITAGAEATTNQTLNAWGNYDEQGTPLSYNTTAHVDRTNSYINWWANAGVTYDNEAKDGIWAYAESGSDLHAHAEARYNVTGNNWWAYANTDADRHLNLGFTAGADYDNQKDMTYGASLGNRNATYGMNAEAHATYNISDTPISVYGNAAS